MIDLNALNQDIRQRFESTYVRLGSERTGKTQVFFLEKVVPGTPYPTLQLKNDDVGSVQLKYDSNVRILLQPPESGYFFFREKYALVFQRWMGRQWKRTVCSGNSRIHCPYNEIALGVGPQTRLSTELVSAAYAAERRTYQEAVDMLDKRLALSVPISQHLALGLNPVGVKSHVLWFLQTPIAEVFAAASVIRMHETPFNQEVVDFCKKENLRAQII